MPIYLTFPISAQKPTISQYLFTSYNSESFKILSLKNSNKGFTLLELLIVCAIMATLASIAVPPYAHLLSSLKKDEALADIKTIANTIALFEIANGYLPNTLEEAGIDMLDPWGNPYQYIPISGRSLTGKDKANPRKDKFLHPLNSDFDLWSMGPDEKTALPLTANASRDDLLRAGNGSYFGVAGDY